jgi:hypothetical protein
MLRVLVTQLVKDTEGKVEDESINCKFACTKSVGS